MIATSYINVAVNLEIFISTTVRNMYMSYAVTHVLLSIIAVDVYRDYITKHKRYFPLYTLLVAGIAGLLPDIDVPINWLLGLFGYAPEFLRHGGVTHTPLFGLIFLIPALYFFKKQRHKLSVMFFVIVFGVLFHLFLDLFLGGGAAEGVMLFWPVSVVSYKVHLLHYVGLPHLSVGLDALLLLGWISHIVLRKRIKDFI